MRKMTAANSTKTIEEGSNEMGKLIWSELAERGISGAFAGLSGGIVFGVWMAEKGMFPVIASMAGGNSAILGLTMHLAISAAIGASFGILCSRFAESTLPSTLWGMVYGFAWWFLGPLTLMPVMMGGSPQWTAAAVAGTIPSLIWHLVFGGVMGISYFAAALEVHRLRSRMLPREA